VGTQPVFAQVVIKEATEKYWVVDLAYYKTDSLAADVADILSADFHPLDLNRNGSLGFDPLAHWFRFDVVNQSTEENWLLEIAYAPLDRVDLFSQDSAGHWIKQSGGDKFPLSTRKYRNRHLVFDLNLPTGRTQTLYIKVVTTSSIQVPLTIWSKDQLQENNYESQFGHGIFYGIVLIMIFYNLFLYLSIRDQTTLYYIITLLSGANVIAFFQGYGFFYIYPEHPEWSDAFSAFSSPLFIVASVALTRSFLSLKNFSHYLDRTLVAIAVVSVIAGIAVYFWSAVFTFISLHLLAIFDFVLILGSALYCFLKNYRPARYFLLAWISLLLVGALFSLRNIGFIQGNWFTNNALYFGGIMQTMLISFALGDRINLLKRENEEARQRELEGEQKAKGRLEAEVTLRTEEISKQKDQLEESNAIKDKLFSIISHDLKGPLNSLKGTLTIWQLGALKPEELKTLTTSIGEQLHQTSEFMDNLLQWAKSQMQGEVVRPEKIDLKNLVQISTDLLLPEYHKKGIAFTTHVPEKSFVFADLTMIRTVIRNLASNALKFTPPGGSVEIAVLKNKENVSISVKDTGVGISLEAMSQIFTLQSVTTSGTREEKGTGIGLVLCKEFVERNNGTIEVESEEGKGVNGKE
jgi:two-component system, sensor histidine kinase LadS